MTLGSGLHGAEAVRDVPEAHVGALGLVVEEFELVWVLLHAPHQVFRHLEQVVDVLLETFVALQGIGGVTRSGNQDRRKEPP